MRVPECLLAAARSTTVEAATLALLTVFGSWRVVVIGRGGRHGHHQILSLVGWINLASASVALLAIHLRRRRAGEGTEETMDGAAAARGGGRGGGDGCDGDGIAVGSMLVPLFVAAAAASSADGATSAGAGGFGSCDAAAIAGASGGDAPCAVASSSPHLHRRGGGRVGGPSVSEWYALASSLAGLYFASSCLLSCIVGSDQDSAASVAANNRRKLVDVLRSSSSSSSSSPALREALFYAAALVTLRLLKLGGDAEIGSSRFWSMSCLVLAFKCVSTAIFHPGDVGGGSGRKTDSSNGHRVETVKSPPSAVTGINAVFRYGASSNGNGGGPMEEDGGDGPPDAAHRNREGNGHVVEATMTESSNGRQRPEPRPTAKAVGSTGGAGGGSATSSSTTSVPVVTASEGPPRAQVRRRRALPVTPGEFAAASTLASVGLADYVARYLVPHHASRWGGASSLGGCLGPGLEPMGTHLAAAHGGLVGCLLGCAASELAARFFVGLALRGGRLLLPPPPRVAANGVGGGVRGGGEDGVRRIRGRGERRGGGAVPTFLECALRFVVLASVAFACVDKALEECMRWHHPPSFASLSRTHERGVSWPTTWSSPPSLPGALSLRWIGAFLSTPEGSDELEALMGVGSPPVEVGSVGVGGSENCLDEDLFAADRCLGGDGDDGVVASLKTMLGPLGSAAARLQLGGGTARGTATVRGSWLAYWVAVLLASTPFAGWLAARQLRRRRRRRRSSVATDWQSVGTANGGEHGPRTSSSTSILVPSSSRGEVVVARKYFHLVAVALFAPATASAPSVMSLSYAVALALLIVVESLRLAAMGGVAAEVVGDNDGSDDDPQWDWGGGLRGAGGTPSAAAAAGDPNGAAGAGRRGNEPGAGEGVDESQHVSNGAHANNGSSADAFKGDAANGSFSGSNGHAKGENDHNGHDRNGCDDHRRSAAGRTTTAREGDAETNTTLASLNDFYVAFLDDKDTDGAHGGVVVTHAALIVGCALPLWTAAALFESDRVDGVSATSSSSLLGTLLPYVGIIVLGVGDAFGAVLGTYLGRHRWPGTRRTAEGSLAMLLGMVAFTVVLLNQTMPAVDQGSPVVRAGWDEWCRVLVVMVVLTVLEASTSQIDNFCLPLAGTALVLILGTDMSPTYP